MKPTPLAGGKLIIYQSRETATGTIGEEFITLQGFNVRLETSASSNPCRHFMA
jgi:hypothetical protein